jgi:hypothetical protein
MLLVQSFFVGKNREIGRKTSAVNYSCLAAKGHVGQISHRAKGHVGQILHPAKPNHITEIIENFGLQNPDVW